MVRDRHCARRARALPTGAAPLVIRGAGTPHGTGGRDLCLAVRIHLLERRIVRGHVGRLPMRSPGVLLLALATGSRFQRVSRPRVHRCPSGSERATRRSTARFATRRVRFSTRLTCSVCSCRVSACSISLLSSRGFRPAVSAVCLRGNRDGPALAELRGSCRSHGDQPLPRAQGNHARWAACV